MNDTGLITLPSGFPVSETLDRLASVITSKGLIVFARIDHAANAVGVDMALRPNELLIFGHPRGGTPLMQDRPTAGLDLPFKALAWEDEMGKVWLTYNDPVWLARRHGSGSKSASSVEGIKNGMMMIVKAALEQ